MVWEDMTETDRARMTDSSASLVTMDPEADPLAGPPYDPSPEPYGSGDYDDRPWEPDPEPSGTYCACADPDCPTPDGQYTHGPDNDHPKWINCGS